MIKLTFVLAFFSVSCAPVVSTGFETEPDSGVIDAGTDGGTVECKPDYEHGNKDCHVHWDEAVKYLWYLDSTTGD